MMSRWSVLLTFFLSYFNLMELAKHISKKNEPKLDSVELLSERMNYFLNFPQEREVSALLALAIKLKWCEEVSSYSAMKCCGVNGRQLLKTLSQAVKEKIPL